MFEVNGLVMQRDAAQVAAIAPVGKFILPLLRGKRPVSILSSRCAQTGVCLIRSLVLAIIGVAFVQYFFSLREVALATVSEMGLFVLLIVLFHFKSQLPLISCSVFFVSFRQFALIGNVIDRAVFLPLVFSLIPPLLSLPSVVIPSLCFLVTATLLTVGLKPIGFCGTRGKRGQWPKVLPARTPFFVGMRVGIFFYARTSVSNVLRDLYFFRRLASHPVAELFFGTANTTMPSQISSPSLNETRSGQRLPTGAADLLWWYFCISHTVHSLVVNKLVRLVGTFVASLRAACILAQKGEQYGRL